MTSGSTGASKGVALSERAVITSARLMGLRKGLAGGLDLAILTQPLSHVGGLIVNFLAQTLAGVTTVLTGEHFNPHEVLSAAEAEGCTVLDSVPAQLAMYLQVLARTSLDLPTICKGATGADMLSDAVLREATRGRTGLRIKFLVKSYGLTESASACVMGSAEDPLEARGCSVGYAQVLPRAGRAKRCRDDCNLISRVTSVLLGTIMF